MSFKVHSKPNHSMTADLVWEEPRHGSNQVATGNGWSRERLPEPALKRVWNILPENYSQDSRVHFISFVQNELGFKK